MRLIATITLLLFTASAAFGTVNVTGVTGTVANGQSITIGGSGFGANGPSVLAFSDFENGTNGSAITTSDPEYGSWSSIPRSGAVYSNASKVSGNLAAKFNGANAPVLVAHAPSNFSSFYMSYWTMIPVGQSTPTSWKQIWVWNNGTDDICINANSLTWLLTFSNHYPGGDTGTLFANRSLSLQMTTGVWYRISWYLKGATDSTGQIRLWYTDPTSGTVKDKDYSAQTVNSLLNYSDFYVNGYMPQDASSTPYFDDVYLAYGDNAQARVEIGDSATYTSCKKLTTLTPTSWADGSVTATVNAGPFTSGNAGYVYVWNADGTVNATGYGPVTFGSGGGDSPVSITGQSATGGAQSLTVTGTQVTTNAPTTRSANIKFQ